MLDNLAATRQYVSYGSGLYGADQPPIPIIAIEGGLTEVYARLDARRFAAAVHARGLDLTLRGHSVGVHYWPYWRRELSSSIVWGLFGEPAATATDRRRFTYRTMAPHGNAWGLGFRFPPHRTPS